MDDDDLWKLIVEIHQHTKDLMLRAEEFDSGLRTFIQPSREMRDELEHIIRAKAAELGIGKGGDAAYITANLRKALGHGYRAFFDVADWLGMMIRKKVRELASEYSSACLREVIPNYYCEIRPNLEQIGKEIAEIRAHKDISRNSDILEEVSHYKNQLDNLQTIYIDMLSKEPSLQEYSVKEGSESKAGEARELVKIRSSRIWDIGIGIVAGLVVAAIAKWLGLV